MRQWFRNLLSAVSGFAWLVAASLAQSPTPSSQPSSPVADRSSEKATPSQDHPGSVAEAARKARQKKTAAAKSKVFTEEDLAGLKGGVSVVGSETKKPAQASPTKAREGEEAQNDEAYWRGKAQPILQEMAEIDGLVSALREDIKKYGPASVDVSTGRKDGVAYVEDRLAKIRGLQKKKDDLQKKLDDLEEQGRKAGAQPAWFR